MRLNPRIILDVGCGPMFISYALTSDETSEYIGVDIMSADRLKKYKDAMNNIGRKRLQVVRASAEQLPFRKYIFDFVLSLDVLEHLSKPKQAVMEIHRVIKSNGLVAISLPLENLAQKLLRIGFTFMKISGDPILKKAKHVPITRTPEYHYVGDIKSYDEMIKMLKESLNFMHTEYTPIGIHKSINVNAVHIAQKKPLT
jgi:ubiquinone/menaquinone biosynthesis C-methylase UbiE